ncbi:alpha/beta hydrolase [Bailinhaonella thermotolerans]|uniref:Alpha/beta hydrolase n=1 Tax=Bailinhaonella thermotolerans TaxID=1070861 RepID=A0A3A4B1H0_9ACTN|nr:alpha/beta hydrolase [Bailinhaonella thermotolerans]RJL31877.1 alpha/beta hydrolase [Bailinhaonella thermotolerans]
MAEFRTRTRRVLPAILLIALTACTALDRSSPSTPDTTRAPAPGLAPFYSQSLDWSDCGDGFECAKLAVPLDYDNPGGDRIEISVIRLPAQGSGRIGSLLVNPGGPGGSGVEYARSASSIVSPALLRAFDIVGFDPRGVGGSTAVRCLPAERLDHFLGLDNTPDSAAEIAELEKGAREFGEGCRARSGKLLPHVSTADAARDMDVLRAALGDQGLTYLGKSYGTLLGAYYAELFPARVRALVLDGAVDPQVPPLEMSAAQARGFEVALRAFAESCLKDSACPLKGSVDDALKEVADLMRTADAEPLGNQAGDRRQVTESWVSLGVAAALYDKGAWPLLRESLAQGARGDGSGLIRLADLLIGRDSSGRYTNQTEANMAVNCVDETFPTTSKDFATAAEKALRGAPRFGSFITWGSLPCAYWPAESGEPDRPLKAAGAAPILVVGTTRDPATPYEWAKALSRQLTSGVLLTYDGDGHTAYRSGSTCVDKAVDTYLTTARAPSPNTTCP